MRDCDCVCVCVCVCECVSTLPPQLDWNGRVKEDQDLCVEEWVPIFRQVFLLKIE